MVSEDLSVVADALAAVKQPAVPAYEVGRILFKSLSGAAYDDWRSRFPSLIHELEDVRLLTAIKPLSETRGFLLFGRQSATTSEVVCCLDPFAYVSHLSAMEYYGLTDRLPRILYLCSPKASDWRTQAYARMAKDLGARLDEYERSGLPLLRRPKLTRYGATVVQIQERSHLGAFRIVSDSSLRVATIGRVFLDMLREPQLCGGIEHVLDVYRGHAKRYLKLIVDEVDRHGGSVDKVRAGYVLTEVCGESDPVIDQWESFAARGGSRKLDAASEYAPQYSERWKLSINVPSLQQP